MRRSARFARFCGVLAALASVIVPGAAAADDPAACSAPGPAGRWATFGRDLANSRHVSEAVAYRAP